MTATSSVHPPASSNSAKTPIKLKVAMAQTVAADEQLLELQTQLKRAETSARYAKAQYNAACEASNARLEEANKQRGVLFDLLKNQVQGSALWNAKIAKQLAENRSQIAAGLVITSRSKLEDLERERDAAKQALDEYTRDSRSFRLAREARARREAAEQRQRELRAKETSPAPRTPPTPVRSHPKGAPLPALPPKSQAEIYRDWYEQTKLAFADYSALAIFPAPPAPRSPCRKTPCATSISKSQLGICVDDIEKAFKMLDLPSMKEERARWHPDRFVRCVERDTMQTMAKEVFQVVDAMYRKEREMRSV